MKETITKCHNHDNDMSECPHLAKINQCSFKIKPFSDQSLVFRKAACYVVKFYLFKDKKKSHNDEVLKTQR